MGYGALQLSKCYIHMWIVASGDHLNCTYLRWFENVVTYKLMGTEVTS
jgi:hypothetical protein